MNATETTAPPAIEFQGISLSCDDRPALVDISFQLDRGELICLTGVSGSGKSTNS